MSTFITTRWLVRYLLSVSVVLAALAWSTPGWAASPVIDVFNGPFQSFGQLGRPQTWINIHGNVSDPDGDALTSLTYSLNGQPDAPLSIGKSHSRLVCTGDFNIEIDADALTAGANTVVITVIDSNSEQSQSTVTVDYTPGNTWSLPYSIDWTNASAISNVAQIVDGEIQTRVTFETVLGGVGFVHRCLGHNESLPHQDSEAKQDEHLAFLELVEYSDVDAAAVSSGLWSDPETWVGRLIPEADSNVLIVHDITVIYDVVSTMPIRTIRVDGELRFDHENDTQLYVDTLAVSPGGELIIGTEANPIGAGVTATIVIADNGAIDTDWDPTLTSRGVISHGTVSIYGEEKSGFHALVQTPRAGDTTLELAGEEPTWHVGNQLVLTGTNPDPDHNEDEELEILGISYDPSQDVTSLSVRPLVFDHLTPASDLSVYVANLTRNVVVASQNTEDIGQRGHFMSMHSQKVEVHHAAFQGLGRTDKKNSINDPVLDANENLVDGTGTNRRGRYALHFHRTGTAPGATAAVVDGVVINGSPGWGLVNHSSNVDVTDSVTFNVVGAGFVSEVGDEIGSYKGNIAIRSEGSGFVPDKRQFVLGKENDPVNPKNDDFGHSGHGFWFQGPGLIVEDNVAVGHRHAGFVFWNRALVEFDIHTEEELAMFGSNVSVPSFRAANVIDQPELTEGVEFVRSEFVKIRSFKNNVAFASSLGLDISRHMLTIGKKFQALGWEGVIDNFTAWNIGTFNEHGTNPLNGDDRGAQGGNNGVTVRYSRNLVFRNLRLIGLGDPESVGVNRNHAVNNVIVENPQIQGFGVAVDSDLIVTGPPAGVTVTLSCPDLATTEAGGTATFDVVLDTAPAATVTIGILSDNTAEGTVSPASLTFTPDDWDLAQTVTGVDDSVVDGDTPYTIRLNPASSGDSAYSGLDVADVSVTNLDDDVALPPGTIDFSAVAVSSYGGSGQDVSGSAAIEDAGATLHIVGNAWKKIGLPYEVTANTVLEFDFSSNAEGELHGIGLDTDNGIDAGRMFQLFGTQDWGISDFDDYSPLDGSKHYVIPVGQFFTGQMDFLTFVSDHDVSSPTAESLFSNVVIREAGGGAEPGQ